ncbi:MAG: DUF2384 domain-containing protein [Bradymonadales bacterium]|nr:MAG: DUF2384 domain-containing protein [Bradymonadales bacterium]
MRNSIKEERIEYGTPEAGGVLWKAFDRSRIELDMKPSEVSRLLGIKLPTIEGWKKKGSIHQENKSNDRLPQRIEVVYTFIAIFRSLAAVFSSRDDRRQWMFTKNLHFEGQSPFDYASKSLNNLFVLNTYLNFRRGVGV